MRGVELKSRIECVRPGATLLVRGEGCHLDAIKAGSEGITSGALIVLTSGSDEGRLECDSQALMHARGVG